MFMVGQSRWGYRPVLMETFVDPSRFRGTCYRAAGWTLLGRTTATGLVRQGKHYQTSPKLIFAKPLQADFRRLLCRIDVGEIEQTHLALVTQLIRNKKFSRYLINNCYPIGIDGSQKIAFSTLWDEQLLQRRIGPKVAPDGDEEQTDQYYVYVLEASLCFRNGMVIPLMKLDAMVPHDIMVTHPQVLAEALMSLLPDTPG
jgi:hypothetical protein